MRAPLNVAALTVAALLAGACGEPTSPGRAPTLSLAPDSISLVPGTSYQPIVAGTSGSERVLYSSSAPEIARVDSGGVVTAVQPGRAVVRAQLDGAPSAQDSLIVRVSECDDCGGWFQISVAAITDTAGAALDLQALRGTIVVDLRTDVMPGTHTFLVEVRVDSVAVCSGPAPSGLAAPSSCRIDTEAMVGAARKFSPGKHVLMGLLEKAGGGLILATTSLPVTFASASSQEAGGR